MQLHRRGEAAIFELFFKEIYVRFEHTTQPDYSLMFLAGE
jgi:hypothetical protein